MDPKDSQTFVSKLHVEVTLQHVVIQQHDA